MSCKYDPGHPKLIPDEASPGEAAAVAISCAQEIRPSIASARYRGHVLLVHADDHVLRLERTIIRRLRTGAPRNQIICVPTRYGGSDPELLEAFLRGDDVPSEHTDEYEYENQRAGEA